MKILGTLGVRVAPRKLGRGSDPSGWLVVPTPIRRELDLRSKKRTIELLMPWLQIPWPEDERFSKSADGEKLA